MRRAVFIALACFMCSCRYQSVQEDGMIDKKRKEVSVSVDSLINLTSVQRMKEIEILYDPGFGSKKSYEGVRLNDVLTSLLRHYKFSADKTDVIFMCKDGYAPVRYAPELLQPASGYIVYKDLEAANGRNWPDSVYDRYHPFYLVWNVDSIKAGDLPWPYGLVQIRLVEKDSLLLNILSKKKANLKGYHLFRKHCFSCHAINHVGGQVGPEMNVPKNITEYWTDDNISHYIKEPKSFRYNARMPAMKHINDEDIRQIIAYLHFMKKYKAP